MKKVWILNHYAGNMFFDKGGRHYWFAKYLKREGYFPVVFCCNSKHGGNETFFRNDILFRVKKEDTIDVPFVFVKGRPYPGNGKNRILNMVDFYFNVQRSAKMYAQKHGVPDVILASSVHPLTMLAGIQLAKRFGVKCVCEVRDLWPESIVSYGIAKEKSALINILYRGEKYLYLHSDELVFTMENAWEYFEEKGLDKCISRNKVHYINNGVDIEWFNECKRKYQVKDEDLDNIEVFKVVYTGSIKKVNNLGLLLDVAKRIKNNKIKILIWGEGEEKSKLEKRVKDESIGNVIFKGRVDKKYIPYIVSKADLNILHSTPSSIFRFGISPNKMLDYLAAGKPVLSDFPCEYNPAVQAGAGTDVNNPSPELIAIEIEKYFNMDEDSYSKMCENALAASKEYDFKCLTKKLVEVIE